MKLQLKTDYVKQRMKQMKECFTEINIKDTLEKMKEKEFLLRALPITVIAVILIVFAVWLNAPGENDVPTQSGQLHFAKAKVTAVLEDNAAADFENAEGRRVGSQEIEVKILSGSHKDEIMATTNYLSALYNVDVEKGDRIIVRILTNNDGSYYASIYNYDRGIVLCIFLLAFFVLLAVLGGWKGVRALLGLLLTLVCIWFILIPCIIRGISAVTMTVLITGLAAAGALVLLNGFSRKTLAAVLGCFGGVLAAGLIAAVVGWLSPMNGFNLDEAENLLLYGADKGLKLSGLMVCGVLISAMGAVMDVSLGIASSISELKAQNPSAGADSLFHSGMQVGRDAMGTMANTLILAFAGASLNTLILIQTYDVPFLQLVNTDFFCLEVVQSVSGSFGILLTVPLVALISSRLMASDKPLKGAERLKSKNRS